MASGPHYLYRLRPGAKACLNYGKPMAHRACLVILLTTPILCTGEPFSGPFGGSRSHVKRDSQEFFLIRDRSYHIRYRGRLMGLPRQAQRKSLPGLDDRPEKKAC